MSIAVLRTFISKRKQEQETMMSRKRKSGPKAVGEPTVEPEILKDTVIDVGESNGEREVPSEISQEEPCSISEDPATNHEGKGRGEVKPPRVLEVTIGLMLILLLLIAGDSLCYMYSYISCSSGLHFFTCCLTGTVGFWTQGFKICSGSGWNWSSCCPGQ